MRTKCRRSCETPTMTFLNEVRVPSNPSATTEPSPPHEGDTPQEQPNPQPLQQATAPDPSLSQPTPQQQEQQQGEVWAAPGERRIIPNWEQSFAARLAYLHAHRRLHPAGARSQARSPGAHGHRTAADAQPVRHRRRAPGQPAGLAFNTIGASAVPAGSSKPRHSTTISTRSPSSSKPPAQAKQKQRNSNPPHQHTHPQTTRNPKPANAKTMATTQKRKQIMTQRQKPPTCRGLCAKHDLEHKRRKTQTKRQRKSTDQQPYRREKKRTQTSKRNNNHHSNTNKPNEQQQKQSLEQAERTAKVQHRTRQAAAATSHHHNQQMAPISPPSSDTSLPSQLQQGLPVLRDLLRHVSHQARAQTAHTNKQTHPHLMPRPPPVPPCPEELLLALQISQTLTTHIQTLTSKIVATHQHTPTSPNQPHHNDVITIDSQESPVQEQQPRPAPALPTTQLPLQAPLPQVHSAAETAASQAATQAWPHAPTTAEAPEQRAGQAERQAQHTQREQTAHTEQSSRSTDTAQAARADKAQASHNIPPHNSQIVSGHIVFAELYYMVITAHS